MKYDKKDITGKSVKKGRFPYNSGGGPRDQQRRLSLMGQLEDGSVNNVLVEELRNQVANLTKELIGRSKSIGEFSADEVDEEIRKAVAGAVKETGNKYEKKISNLEIKIRNRDKMIDEFRAEESTKIVELTKKMEDLTTAVSIAQEVQIDADPDRPKMEEVFIDPLEEDAGKELEDHVTIKDAPLMEKFEMDEKVDKLKGMLGKLPSFKK